jgi:prenyltransferase beta subunit
LLQASAKEHTVRVWRVTLVILLVISVFAAPLAPAQPSAAAEPSFSVRQRDSVVAALAWLRTQQLADGSFAPLSQEAAAVACDAVLAISAAGQDASDFSRAVVGARSALDYLETLAVAHLDSASHVGRLALAAVAAHRSPTDFGGVDLMARLAALRADEVFGSSTSDQAWSLLALAAARQPIEPAARLHLAGQQLPDGGWESGAGEGANVATTSLALQALVAARQAVTSTVVVDGMAYLANHQNPDGGFSDAPAAQGAQSDAYSTSAAIQALIACGSNPLSSPWLQSDGNPVTFLLGLQQGNGALAPQMGQAATLAATVQAVPGLLGKCLPLPGRHVARRDAIAWLRQQVHPDGSFPATSTNALGSTAQAVTALAAAGEYPGTWVQPSGQSPLAYLATQVENATNAGLLARLILAVGASYRNPFRFGGRDLVSQLRALYDSESGGFSAVDNIWDHCTAVWALHSTGLPVSEASLRWLLARQNSNGGWGWALGQDSDTNSTSLSVQTLALGPLELSASATAAAIGFLRRQQRYDGGFPWVTPSPWGDDSDANSTAMVIQALWSAQEEPAGLAWMTAPSATDAITLALHGPMDRLLEFQLPSGAFEWQTGYGPDFMATVQALPVLVRHTGPILSSGVTAAQNALAWLRAQQADDGSFSGSSDDPALTSCDALLAIVSAGQDPHVWKTGAMSSKTVLDYLGSSADRFATDAAATGKLIAAITAAGQDATRFGGINLVARLLSLRAEDTWGSSATDQSWAILGLSVTRQPIPAETIERLRAYQQPDGGWETAPGSGSDAPTTALALQALVAARQSGSSAAVASALQYYVARQNEDGGFATRLGSGSSSTAIATASAVQAILAGGQDPFTATWARSAGNPFGRLIGFQLANGALADQSGSGASVEATAQAIPALLGETLISRPAPLYPVLLPLLLGGHVD